VESRIFKNNQALHEAIYNCTLCRDSGYPVQRVQPKWDPKRGHRSIKKWGMLIGQAPGRTERRRARELRKHKATHESRSKSGYLPVAFAGDAGRRLAEWLGKDAGFTPRQIRTQFYKTAVTKCFPGRDRRNTDRKPTKREIENCSHFLKEQIRLVNPSILIPIGKVAINWFFPEVRRLEEVVGKKRQWIQAGSKYDVICLPHPSNVSGWWKKKGNRPRRKRATKKLSELRKASLR
jgi:uracil-DNA glycosylase family 4